MKVTEPTQERLHRFTSLDPGRCPRFPAFPGYKARGEEAVTVDEDLEQLNREALISEVRKLRAGIRSHRDSSGHDLCWHHPQLWSLLPETIDPDVAVPPWPKFLRGCVAYRESLDRELPDAPAADVEYDDDGTGVSQSRSPNR